MIGQAKEFCPNSNSSIYEKQISILIESLSISQAHQTLFTKNFELLKTKYQKILNPNISTENLKSLHFFSENYSFPLRKSVLKKKIDQMLQTKKLYVYLAFLTIYELEIQKTHINFVNLYFDFKMNKIY